VYASIYALVSIPSVLSSAVTTVLFPRLAGKFWNAGDARRARVFSLLAYSVVSVASLLALTALARPLLAIMLGVEAPADLDVPLVFFLTGFGVCLFGAARILGVELFVSRKTGRAALVWSLVALLNVGLNLLLIKPLGLTGAGLANFVSYLAFLLAMVFYARRTRVETSE
jgi:O-antigen/teichoic acid export membrane protein